MVESRGKRVFLIAFGALLLLVGIGMLIIGEERLFAALAALPFGAACIALGRSRPPAVGTRTGIEPGTMDVRGRTLHGLRLEPDDARTGTVAVILLAFVSMGLAFTLQPDVVDDPQTTRVAGVLCVAIFGGLALTRLPRLLRGGGASLLAPEGIALENGRTFVPWEAIEDVRVLAVGDTELLGLVLGDRRAVRTGPVTHALMRLGRLGGAHLNLPLSLLGADAALVAEGVARLLDEPERRAHLGTGDLAALTGAGTG